jgi:membrane carboxypeptidase/penicillin-binding protein PbpC
MGSLAFPAAEQALSPQIAYLITSILSDDAARIPAFGEGSLLQLERPAAAKTGTTTDFRDNWTLGYTPDLAVGVWAGNADNAPMYRVTGITGAGPIWHDFMETAHRGIPARPFVPPGGLVEIEICDASGLLPTPICPRIRSEVFIQGTEPRRADNAYQSFALDAPTNLLWAEGCRGPRIVRVFRVYPPDAQDWAQKKGLALPPEMDCRGTWTGAAQAQGDAAIPLTAPSARPALEIVSPAPNSIFQSSPQLPAELQQVEVTARLNQSLRLAQVTLLLDGQPIGKFTMLPYRALWQLRAGEHTAQAVGVTADGAKVTSELVHFTVMQTP